jgi:hypothetical protein
MILPLVLAFLAIGLLLITPTLGHGYSAIADTRVAENRVEQVNAADSGLEEGIRWLLAGKIVGGAWSESAGEWLREPYTMNGSSVTVAVVPTAIENTYVISSEVMMSSGIPLILFSRVKVLPGGVVEVDDITRKFYGDVLIPEGGFLGNGYHIVGNVFAAGSVTLDSGSRVTGGVSASGDTTLASGSKVNGTLCAGADEDGIFTIAVEQGSKPDTGETLTVYLLVNDGEEGTLNLGTTGSGSAAKITTVYIQANDTATVNVNVENGTIDNLYVVSGGFATVTISVDDSSDIGHVYATTPGDVSYAYTVITWDGVSPPTPECPTFPKPVADIETYEFD